MIKQYAKFKVIYIKIKINPSKPDGVNFIDLSLIYNNKIYLWIDNDTFE